MDDSTPPQESIARKDYVKRVRNKSLHTSQENNTSVLEVDDLAKPNKNSLTSETTFLAGTKDLPQSTRIEEEDEDIILLD